MLGVVHEGVAFPLVWTMLDKKGNSNYKERINLLQEFREIFPEVVVDYITGDREFIKKMVTVTIFLMARIPSIPRWSLATLKLENSKYSSADAGCGVIGCT
jgi:hypothetical protein